MGDTCSSHGGDEKPVGCDTVIGNLQLKRPPGSFQEIVYGLVSSVCGFCGDDDDDDDGDDHEHEHSGSLKDREFSYPAKGLSVSQGIVCPIQFR
jgi:hypothetical protein